MAHPTKILGGPWPTLQRPHVIVYYNTSAILSVSKSVRTLIVSKATKRHCAGTVQSQAGRAGNVKQVGLGFEPRPEDSYGRCGSDKIRQTVPDASSGDRKSSVTDGRQ